MRESGLSGKPSLIDQGKKNINKIPAFIKRKTKDLIN